MSQNHKNGPQKGKKSVRWDRDPVILLRLESVAQMMLRRARAWQIAETLDTSIATAKRDIRRVRILWRKASEHNIEEFRQGSLAQLFAIQQQAWTRFDGKQPSEEGSTERQAKKAGIRWLRLALECEREIMDLLGTKAPVKIAPTDPSGEKEYGSLTNDQRTTRVMALLGIARARRDQKASGDAGANGSGADAVGVDASQSLDTGQDNKQG